MPKPRKARYLLTPAWCREMAIAASKTAGYIEEMAADAQLPANEVAEFAEACRAWARANERLGPVLATAGVKD